jgi:hypothetical protein
MYSIAFGLETEPVGSSSKSAVAKSCYRRSIGDQQI